MNKKGKNLPIKALMVLILLLTILSGIDSIFIGLTKGSLVGQIMPISVLFVAYAIIGLAVLTTALVLAFKIFKK